ncbi:MAG TPA: hypothetical protein DF699_16010, partial [Phycisphaerales bacterium]|nr:hypothetical protein [Phycisphaerales bacterium]
AEPIAPWAELSVDKHTTGRITFSGQPSADEIRAFAAAGGNVVVNNRTEPEMKRVPFDEQALVESLGMTYVHSPMSSAIFCETQASDLSTTLNTTTGPVLMHCGSGSRSATVYGLYLIKDKGMNKNDAIKTAQELGMGSSGG